MKHTAAIRRFGSREADPASAIGLRSDHPALQGAGRTIFPTTVVGSMASPRFLVSGHNNPKLGKEVLKGPRTGWPIFHLTLEERATCPRSCEQWATCFGNAMPHSRRHAVDDDFLPLLRGEVATLARANPKGLLIRLHALGDFYSAEYVVAWAEMLAMFPQIAVFGYTARRVDDPDPKSALIARVINMLTEGQWERFSIRTSASDPIARSRAIVIDEMPSDEDTIVCPAQTGATEACATCGLCWAGAARDKTIAFLRHGMTDRRGPREPKPQPEPPPAPPTSQRGKTARAVRAAPLARDDEVSVLAALRTLAGGKAEVDVSLSVLAKAAAVPTGSVLFVVRRLVDAGKIAVTRNAGKGRKPAPNTYRLIGPAEPPPRPKESVLWEKVEPVVRKSAPRPVPATDCPQVPAAPPPAPATDAGFRPLELPETPNVAGIKPLTQLGTRECHWPIGEPSPIQMYCGDPTETGEEYCRGHASKMFASHRAAKRSPAGARL